MVGKLNIEQNFKNKLNAILDNKKIIKTPNNIVKGTQSNSQQTNINHKTYSNISYKNIKDNQNISQSLPVISSQNVLNKHININLNFDKYYEFFMLAIILGIGFELGSKIGFILFYN